MNVRLKFEHQAIRAGYKNIAGVDEAGRGPLAGPVVAAAVILSDDSSGLEAITDSKKLSPKKRKELFILIHERAKSIGVGVVDAPTIDKINILQSTFLAMEKAFRTMSRNPDYLLIDGNQRPSWVDKGETMVKGDSRSLSIAAASIVAKVTRDKIMEDYDHHYPVWGFANHKGYGTAGHIRAIKENGICEIHRKSFAPISRMNLK